MRFILDLFLALVLVVLFFFGLGFMLSDSSRVERQMLIERPNVHVYDALNSLQRFPLWSALSTKDPNVKMTVSGPESGKGSRVEWASAVEAVGNGSIEITEHQELQGVAYNLDMGPDKAGLSRVILTNKAGEYGVRVIWNFTVKHGDNVLKRYRGLYLDGAIGDTLHLSLLRLKYLLENTPWGADYSDIQITETKLTPGPAYTITATAKCFAEVGQATCQPDVPAERAKAMAELEAFIKRNKINAVGKPRFAYVSKEPYTITFDLQIPTDRNDVKPSGTIQVSETLGGKVVIGEHIGFQDNTEPTWQKVMAYMSVRGMLPVEGVAGRQVDEYVSDPATTEAQFFTTNVYQPVLDAGTAPAAPSAETAPASAATSTEPAATTTPATP